MVFGSSTAGGAYAPGMSDYTIFVEKQAQVFLGGPPLVKMATGEISTAEELGGAEMHSRISGLADQMARDEFEGIEFARRWVGSIRRSQRQGIERRISVREPSYDSGKFVGDGGVDGRGIAGDYSHGYSTAFGYEGSSP